MKEGNFYSKYRHEVKNCAILTRDGLDGWVDAIGVWRRIWLVHDWNMTNPIIMASVPVCEYDKKYSRYVQKWFTFDIFIVQ